MLWRCGGTPRGIALEIECRARDTRRRERTFAIEWLVRRRANTLLIVLVAEPTRVAFEAARQAFEAAVCTHRTGKVWKQ